MNKKYIYVIFVISLLLILGFAVFYFKKTSPATVQKPIEKTEVTAVNKFPDQIRDLKKDEKVTITSGSESVTINNPAKNATEILSPNDVIAKRDPQYEIVYFIYSDKKSFLISIIGKDIEASRKAAEENFLSLLGIDKEKACKLSVSLFVDKDINAQTAGQDYHLSFCPDGKAFPK